MDGNADLRRSCQRVVAVASHAQRHTEHALLDRLYYKNRSQHRRAPYFRRLDHVRRILKKSASHRVWTSLSEAADESRALAFSSLTVSDLDDLVAGLSVAPYRAIPVAARALVVELVSRGYFIPFSLTAIAVLARLYVIERQLCIELSVALSDMRVLLAIQPRLRPVGEAASAPGPTELESLEEDVGEPIAIASPKRGDASPARTKQALPPGPVEATAGVEDGRKGGDEALVGRVPWPSQAPSLYELMAADDDEGNVSAIIGCITGRSTVGATRPALVLPFGRPPRAAVLGSSGSSDICPSSGTARNDDANKKPDNVDDKAEDIDDIFGDL
jgi:hypothetical protein